MKAIDTLDTDVRALCDRHLALCLMEGIVLRVTDGFRSFARQAELYEQGRTTPGAIVTHARPGHSWHTWKRAYDVCIVTFPADLTPKDVYDGPWERVGAIGESLGLTWGGHFTHPDRPHWEYPNGRTIAGMLAKYPNGLEGDQS
jgi:peptidoglycan L-alanyl-D-glutamate endopeptidase CwlK